MGAAPPLDSAVMTDATLILRLVGLPPGHSKYEGHVEFTVLDAAGVEEPYRVDVRCEADNLGMRVHVRGDVTGSARSVCHRCLANFARPVEAHFALTLQRGLAAGDSDDIVGVPENAAEFDLSPHVREAVILEEPIQLLCAPDCRGLCPQCGADLNQGACGCAPVRDERWAPLRDLPGLPEI
jgi:uncharacterized protein